LADMMISLPSDAMIKRRFMTLKNRILPILGCMLLFAVGYLAGHGNAMVAHAQTPTRGGIPKAYGHLVSAVVNPEGTGLIFEDGDGVIRMVTITGKVESELTRN
jgi:hypothetical protein